MRRRELAESLEHLRRAQRLLDGADAPAEIGCHLDLAICHLKALLRMSPDRLPVEAIAEAKAAADCPWDRQPL
jgi:hypothetical protein